VISEATRQLVLYVLSNDLDITHLNKSEHLENAGATSCWNQSFW